MTHSTHHHTPRHANTNQRIHVVDAARAEREGISPEVILAVAAWNRNPNGIHNKAARARQAVQAMRLRQVAASMHAPMLAAA